MKSYLDLEIYRDSRILAIEIHRLSLSLPKFELFEEGSQIRRSSKSITSLIVEGYGRKRYKQEFIKYLTYAHAECDETRVHLDFLFETGSITIKEVYLVLREKYENLSRKINSFIRYVEDHWNEFYIPSKD